MNILMGWLTPIRAICLWLDCIVFSLVDDVYDLFQTIAQNEVISSNAFKSLMQSMYVLVTLIAFFRLAIMLVNAIIDPDKLFSSGSKNSNKAGLSGMFGRVVLMIVALVGAPFAFDMLSDLQGKVVDENIIMEAILNTNESEGIKVYDKDKGEFVNDAGKDMQKIVITSLIKPEEAYFEEGEAGVQKFLADENIKKKGDAKDYVNSHCGSTCKKAMVQYHQMLSQSSKGGFKLRRLAGYIGGSKEFALDDEEEKQDVYYYEYYAIVTTITGIGLTYVLLSWSIDIAVRAIELAVLRLLSPLFIATIIDPKSTASGGYFNNFIKRYGKTYADLFIKLATIAIAILLISLLQDANIFNTVTGGVFIG